MKNFFGSIFSAIALLFFAVCTKAAHLQFAISQNPVTGRMRKKLGNVVFTTNFGFNVIRSKPLNVKNPQSTKQTGQRTKFTVAMDFLKVILNVLQIGWREMAIGKSAFNACMSDTIMNAITGTAPDYSVDLANLKVASGSLLGYDSLAISAAAGKKVSLAWTDNSGEGSAKDTDEVCVFCYNNTKKQFQFSYKQAFRADESLDVIVPTAWVGDTVKVYAFLNSVSYKKVSTSTAPTDVVILT